MDVTEYSVIARSIIGPLNVKEQVCCLRIRDQSLHLKGLGKAVLFFFSNNILMLIQKRQYIRRNFNFLVLKEKSHTKKWLFGKLKLYVDPRRVPECNIWFPQRFRDKG